MIPGTPAHYYMAPGTSAHFHRAPGTPAQPFHTAPGTPVHFYMAPGTPAQSFHPALGTPVHFYMALGTPALHFHCTCGSAFAAGLPASPMAPPQGSAGFLGSTSLPLAWVWVQDSCYLHSCGNQVHRSGCLWLPHLRSECLPSALCSMCSGSRSGSMVPQPAGLTELQ